ncbi:MAG: cyclic nucleotide-binding domain-containing protein, partial [Planctomycetota bacterium]|nr:cyclic nucleotide-binding domain-containing protein [Planctomycetota bacterium]
EGEEGDRDLSLWERMFFLGSVPLFRGMSAERLKLIAEISRPLTVPSGSRIVKEGTPGHHYYVVCSGTVEVAVEGQQVSVLGGGEGFGEAALLSGELRQATVRASSRCDLLSIDQVDFLDLIHVHPSLVRSFTPMIAQRSLQLP